MASQQAEIIGGHILHEKIGEGGMGAVYRATNRLSGQQLALKRVLTSIQDPNADETNHDTHHNTVPKSASAEIREALAREFQTLASLHHPNIVGVLDYGFDSLQNPYFTMELLASPQTILETARGQDIKTKSELLVQLLQALVYLHRRGILHRDIKPSKIPSVEKCCSGFPQAVDSAGETTMHKDPSVQEWFRHSAGAATAALVQ